MADAAAELEACLEPLAMSPEPVDVEALRDLIGSATEPMRRRDEALADLRRQINSVFSSLRDETLSPAYHLAARTAPGFKSFYGIQLARPIHDLGGDNFADLQWSGALEDPDGDFRIEMGISVFARSSDGYLILTAVVQTHSKNGETQVFLRQEHRVLLGSAIESHALADLRGKMLDAVIASLHDANNRLR